MHRPHQHGQTLAVLVQAWPGEAKPLFSPQWYGDPGAPYFSIKEFQVVFGQTVPATSFVSATSPSFISKWSNGWLVIPSADSRRSPAGPKQISLLADDGSAP
jgi:hypothetical protein